MEKLKSIVVGLYNYKPAKMAFWNALGAFLSILAVYLGDLDPKYNVILVPAILAVTKYLNQKYSAK